MLSLVYRYRKIFFYFVLDILDSSDLVLQRFITKIGNSGMCNNFKSDFRMFEEN